MRTCRLLMLQPWSRLTCWQGGFHAKTSVWPANVPDSEQAPDQDFGVSLLGSFAHYDPATSWWKTSQVCLLTMDLDEFSETWPSAGMMWSGKCYPQPNLELPTSENESGLWPTPTGTERSGINPKTGSGAGLSKAVGGQLNPTWVEWLMGFPIGWTDLED